MPETAAVSAAAAHTATRVSPPQQVVAHSAPIGEAAFDPVAAVACS